MFVFKAAEMFPRARCGVLFVLLFVFLFLIETETQRFLSTPPSPVFARAGDNLSLSWSYSSGASRLRQAEFRSEDTPFIVDKFGSGNVTIAQEYRSHIIANISTSQASITFTAVNKTDRKKYYFSIQNEEHETAMNVLEIIVQDKPENVTLSVSTPACLNFKVSVKCSAAGEPKVQNYTLEHFQGGKVDNYSSRDGEWKITMMTFGDNRFQCAAINSIGTARSLEHSVTVNVRIDTTMLETRTVVEGGTFSHSCANTWYYKGRLISSGRRLSIVNITRTQGGSYKCTRDSGCSSSAHFVQLTVTYKPTTVTLAMSRTNVCQGESVVFSCRVSSANPSANFFKLFENETVRSNSSAGVITLSSTGSFSYKCAAKNTVGETNSSSLSISVSRVPPSIQSVQHEVMATEGDDLSLSCMASGVPTPSVSWIKVSTGEHVNGSTLVLTNINRNGAGEYRCEATNECSNTSATSNVTVKYPATIVPLNNRTVEKGNNVTLFCDASGVPAPIILWTHLSTGIKHYDSTWAITNFRYSDLGEYRCDAHNSVGKDTLTVRLVYKGGRCETVCTKGQRCRKVGDIHSCLCDRGKTGPKCSETDSLNSAVNVLLEIIVEFKPEYEDLKNEETKNFTRELETAIREGFKDLGLLHVSFTSLWKGSVNVDMSLVFNETVSKSEVQALMKKLTEGGKLGRFEVSSYFVGPRSSGKGGVHVSDTDNEKECNAYFGGKDCKKAKPSFIILCLVMSIALLALLVIIIAYFVLKKAKRGPFSDDDHSQRYAANRNVDSKGHVNMVYQTPMETLPSKVAVAVDNTTGRDNERDEFEF